MRYLIIFSLVFVGCTEQSITPERDNTVKSSEVERSIESVCLVLSDRKMTSYQLKHISKDSSGIKFKVECKLDNISISGNAMCSDSWIVYSFKAPENIKKAYKDTTLCISGITGQRYSDGISVLGGLCFVDAEIAKATIGKCK